MGERRFSRRRFLRQTAGGGLGAGLFHFVPRYVLGGAGQLSANEKLNIAGIGVGGMGFHNLTQMESENIVALCDVDLNYAGRAFERWPTAQRYTDYRVMLDKQSDIEAVMIATLDHTHAAIALAAMEAGKHVYCQKPLTHDIWEARVLTEAAKRLGVVTQMGNQFHSSDGIRQMCEWVWDGAIGAVREVEAWCSLTYRPFGHAGWSTLVGERPTETPPLPEGLDWEIWLGPAPSRPYHPTYHPARWRAWWDFGCGMMGDRGVHTLDSAFWALKLGAPRSAELVRRWGGNDEIHPDVAIVRFEFPARGDMPPVTVNWYQGMVPPRSEGYPEDQPFGDAEGGLVLKGEKGFIMHGVYAGQVFLLPQSLAESYHPPAPSIPRIGMSHEQHWVHCCKTGERASSDFSYAGPLTEFVLLGNVAIRLGGTIEWDAEKLQARGRPEAEEWIKRPRRTGWRMI
ncbi:MAG: Gfo/Idh/MocA family protein [Candidatus Zipacnadales bacterium]